MPEMQTWLQAALALYMSERAQVTVVLLTYCLSRGAKDGLNPLNQNDLIGLRGRSTPSEFAGLASFIRFWAESDLDSKPSRALVEAYTDTPRKKQSSGDVITRLDPEEGPLTRAEADTLYQWIHEQFSAGELAFERFLYVLLLLIYGQRGVQQRMWVFDDFFVEDGKHKIRIFYAKEKDRDAQWRGKSETFNLSKEHYNLIQAYRKVTLETLKKQYPDSADWDTAIGNVPIFTRKRDRDKKRGFNLPVLVDRPNHKDLEAAPSPGFHIAAGTTIKWLKSMQSMEGFPVSHRTKEPLIISKGHRFRHTVGTDLANEGRTEYEIASALLQKDGRSTRKYRQVSADLMKLIDEKMSDHLAVVVNAFTGRIVRDRGEAINGEQADRQIEDLAVCGSDAMCHLDVPYSCYSCPKFQPLLDGNHREALEHLEGRRAQAISEDKITGVLWDRAILACRKVILDCKALKAGESDGKGEV
ncbi:hypothetical protein [Microbulbifer pacificus]|uniref:hypothetical protein n=1 Tax=Microbulbifer pacificus TaxID=407164 RepID=UPI0018F87D20|nr:hypothetical protein [Microbulbifer pacificus]